jgi:ribosomal protein S27E
MSFTITCNNCGDKQELTPDNQSIIIDIVNENFNDPNYDYIIVTCSNCHNETEI